MTRLLVDLSCYDERQPAGSCDGNTHVGHCGGRTVGIGDIYEPEFLVLVS
jgi:hypothetical protein